MTLSETTPILPNGVAIDHIREARAAMAEAPQAAQFQWRARNRWVNGTHSRTTFFDYFGVGGEQAHKRQFSFDADHPELFAAEDEGPTPVEFLLHALASCLTAGIASVAANRGVQLHQVTSTLEGDMDLQGILGLDPEVRNGYSNIRVTFEVDGDADADQLRRIVEQSKARSAVYDVLTRGVPVHIHVNA